MSGRLSFSSHRAARDLRDARLLMGKRLSALWHDQYYFNGEKHPGDVGFLEWCFGEGEVLSMYLLSDGESVGADSLPLDTPVFFEIEPNASCAWKRENLLAGLSADHLEGAIVRDVEGVLDTATGQEPRLVGFRVSFETGDYLVFLNNGDEAAVFINSQPSPCLGIDTRFVTSID
ncbi:hypothetical protein [Pseudomonas sp. PDM22]|uniref:hypothetical protein n=1 Tax=Pseudomonas sp. PDM22 TaxID=2769287 RepID=UPI001783D611|nr:hypothetical protein [Pseudomonas sp. PDM22]MBD9517447.1 hypothetical protein [Pseudomonas sp. PDM22]